MMVHRPCYATVLKSDFLADRPQGVTVKYQPSVVNENTKLELSCSALSSYPPVKSFTWTKMKGGKTESIGNSPTLTIKSVSPSDSGQYGCTARNEMGIGESEKVEIKVRCKLKLSTHGGK